MKDSYRPWIAAVLAFVYPGLGHIYLRSWLRAAMWFLLAFLTASFIIPEQAITAFEQGGLTSFLQVTSSLPLSTLFPLFVVRLLNIVDAFLTGRSQSQSPQPDHPTCPECGKELDDDLDFCPWCTTRLNTNEDVG
ncbi:MAG: hypothetical protein ABEI06_09755 [Halobacteriaceae archaeon]